MLLAGSDNMLNHFYCLKAGWMYVMSEGTCIHIQINMTDDNLFRIRLNLFAWYVNHTGGKKTFFCMLDFCCTYSPIPERTEVCGLFSWKELKWFSLVLNVVKNTIAVCISTNSTHSEKL